MLQIATFLETRLVNFVLLPVTVVTRIQGGQLRNCGSLPDRGKRRFCFQKRPNLLWGSPSFLFVVEQGLFPWQMRLSLEVDHLPTFNAKVKIIWSCNFTPSYALMPRTGTFIYFLEAHHKL